MQTGSHIGNVSLEDMMVVGAEKRGLGGPLRAKEGTVESPPFLLLWTVSSQEVGAVLRSWHGVQHLMHSRDSANKARRGQSEPTYEEALSRPDGDCPRLPEPGREGSSVLTACLCSDVTYRVCTAVFKCSLPIYCSAANKHLAINDKRGNWGGCGGHV